MSNDDYRLPALNARQARRHGRIVSASLVALVAPPFALVLAIEGTIGWRGAAAFAVVEAAAVGTAVVTRRRLSPGDRIAIESSQGVTLDPLPTNGGGPTGSVGLSPGWRQRRTLRSPGGESIEFDEHGLMLPAWLLDSRPRSLRPDDRVTVPWSSLERCRVISQSEGPDLLILLLSEPCGPSDDPQWSLRIRRVFLQDERALLDVLRRQGGCSIELETSVPQQRRTT